jgi:hypothetical protein
VGTAQGLKRARERRERERETEVFATAVRLALAGCFAATVAAVLFLEAAALRVVFFLAVADRFAEVTGFAFTAAVRVGARFDVAAFLAGAGCLLLATGFLLLAAGCACAATHREAVAMDAADT